jgi:hypothetical protein
MLADVRDGEVAHPLSRVVAAVPRHRVGGSTTLRSPCASEVDEDIIVWCNSDDDAMKCQLPRAGRYGTMPPPRRSATS